MPPNWRRRRCMSAPTHAEMARTYALIHAQRRAPLLPPPPLLLRLYRLRAEAHRVRLLTRALRLIITRLPPIQRFVPTIGCREDLSKGSTFRGITAKQRPTPSSKTLPHHRQQLHRLPLLLHRFLSRSLQLLKLSETLAEKSKGAKRQEALLCEAPGIRMGDPGMS